MLIKKSPLTHVVPALAVETLTVPELAPLPLDDNQATIEAATPLLANDEPTDFHHCHLMMIQQPSKQRLRRLPMMLLW